MIRCTAIMSARSDLDSWAVLTGKASDMMLKKTSWKCQSLNPKDQLIKVDTHILGILGQCLNTRRRYTRAPHPSILSAFPSRCIIDTAQTHNTPLTPIVASIVLYPVSLAGSSVAGEKAAYAMPTLLRLTTSLSLVLVARWNDSMKT